MTDKPKRPRDANQLAKFMVDVATGEIDETDSPKIKQTREAGRVGGKKRAETLTPVERSKIAQIAARARWKKGDD